MIRVFTTIAAITLAVPATAQSFSVSLGGKVLGVMQFEATGSTLKLRSTLNSTPMGVFNGTFLGTSKGTATDSRFIGESRSSRKQRDVTVEIRKGRATDIEIMPEDERTEMSVSAAVPANVLDPVRIFAALARAGDCPSAMQMYDGRRVVRLSADGKGQEGDILICHMNYLVTHGPGHLSPLGIASAKISLSYETSGGEQSLQKMQIASGLFRVTLDHTD